MGNQNRNTGFKNHNNFQHPHTIGNNVNKSIFNNLQHFPRHQNYENKRFNYSDQYYKPENNIKNLNPSDHLLEKHESKSLLMSI